MNPQTNSVNPFNQPTISPAQAAQGRAMQAARPIAQPLQAPQNYAQPVANPLTTNQPTTPFTANQPVANPLAPNQPTAPLTAAPQPTTNQPPAAPTQQPVSTVATAFRITSFCCFGNEVRFRLMKIPLAEICSGFPVTIRMFCHPS